ncbi:MAG: hypothetical protein ACOYOQ_16420, partial [Microthrixaceae bacterium]
KYQTEDCLFGTYETVTGEFGLVRYQLNVIKEEVPGFSAAIVDRNLAEAIFVQATDLDDAIAAVLEDHNGTRRSLAGSLTMRNIAFRMPRGIGATVTALPTRQSQKPISHAA